MVYARISCRGSFRATTGGSSPQATLLRSERRARREGATAIAGAAAGTLMGGLGGRRETAHNATPAADYRTALLSDSP